MVYRDPRNYRDVPRFGISQLVEGEEQTGSVLATVDSELADFLSQVCSCSSSSCSLLSMN